MFLGKACGCREQLGGDLEESWPRADSEGAVISWCFRSCLGHTNISPLPPPPRRPSSGCGDTEEILSKKQEFLENIEQKLTAAKKHCTKNKCSPSGTEAQEV